MKVLYVTACAAALGVVGTAFTLAACGSDGEPGAPGAAGIPGPPGPPGPAGEPGASSLDGGALGGACTNPCHTFNGVVDQWRFSGHSHPQENEIGTGACGNCHAIDGLQQRVAGKFVANDGGAPTNVAQGHISYAGANGAILEISYAGASPIGRIHCTTCHDFNETNDPHVTGKYVAGQAPLRIAGGADDVAYIEKSPAVGSAAGTPLKFRSANTCVFCHKSRKDVTNYVSDVATNALTSYRWGPHEGPQSDIFSAAGAYQKAGKTYGSSEHLSIADKCVTCHMAPVATNGNVPDHTMKPQVKTCTSQQGCHSQYTGTNFDILGGQTQVRNALFEFQRALNTAGYLTRSTSAPYAELSAEELADGQFHLDTVKPQGAGVPGPVAGAIYNYLLIARGRDTGVHNPRYTKQLLFDGIEQITGAAPTSGLTRPQ